PGPPPEISVSGLISITTKSPTLESRSEIKGAGEHCIPSKMITTVRPHRRVAVGADCCESLRGVRGFDQVAVRPRGVLPPMRAVQLLHANEPASLRQLLGLDQPADRVLRLVVGEKLDTGFSAVLIIDDDPRRGDAGLYPRRQQHSPDGHRTLSCSRVGFDFLPSLKGGDSNPHGLGFLLHSRSPAGLEPLRSYTSSTGRHRSTSGQDVLV